LSTRQDVIRSIHFFGLSIVRWVEQNVICALVGEEIRSRRIESYYHNSIDPVSSCLIDNQSNTV